MINSTKQSQLESICCLHVRLDAGINFVAWPILFRSKVPNALDRMSWTHNIQSLGRLLSIKVRWKVESPPDFYGNILSLLSSIDSASCMMWWCMQAGPRWWAEIFHRPCNRRQTASQHTSIRVSLRMSLCWLGPHWQFRQMVCRPCSWLRNLSGQRVFRITLCSRHKLGSVCLVKRICRPHHSAMVKIVAQGYVKHTWLALCCFGKHFHADCVTSNQLALCLLFCDGTLKYACNSVAACGGVSPKPDQVPTLRSAYKTSSNIELKIVCFQGHLERCVGDLGMTLVVNKGDSMRYETLVSSIICKLCAPQKFLSQECWLLKSLDVWCHRMLHKLKRNANMVCSFFSVSHPCGPTLPQCTACWIDQAIVQRTIFLCRQVHNTQLIWVECIHYLSRAPIHTHGCCLSYQLCVYSLGLCWLSVHSQLSMYIRSWTQINCLHKRCCFMSLGKSHMFDAHARNFRTVWLVCQSATDITRHLQDMLLWWDFWLSDSCCSSVGQQDDSSIPLTKRLCSLHAVSQRTSQLTQALSIICRIHVALQYGNLSSCVSTATPEIQMHDLRDTCIRRATNHHVLSTKMENNWWWCECSCRHRWYTLFHCTLVKQYLHKCLSTQFWLGCSPAQAPLTKH